VGASPTRLWALQPADVADAPLRALGPGVPVTMGAGRTFPRWLSLCAAALAILQLGGLVHLAAAPHGVCWEHGVVVELDTAPVGAESVGAREGLTRAAAPLVRSSEHPHCPALWVRGQARLEVAGTARLLVPPQHRAVVAHPEQLPPPAGWALRRAPKQSPPV
jgi:hypothetical protein